MTFLAPWAFAIGGLAAAAIVVLHLVARQRPAAYVLPTTRFIPDQRTLVSRVATRPRDLLLLVLRALLLLCAGAAFARPVLTPTRGTTAHVILLDRSRAVANVKDAVTLARKLVSDGAPVTVVAFDSVPTVLASAAWDSLAGAPRTESAGSLSAALVAARRASATVATDVDSVLLHIVSPIAQSEIDSATARVRAMWPGAIRVERVATRPDSSTPWRLERTLSAADPLGPALLSSRGSESMRLSSRTRSVSGSPTRGANSTPPCDQSRSRQSLRDCGMTAECVTSGYRDCGMTTRLVRGALSSGDSAFARGGGTVVRWDTSAAPRVAPEGLAVGDDVIVAALGRVAVSQTGRVAARWADGQRAAAEVQLGSGCLREVGVVLPAAGDIALHPPFQRIARGLLAPCGLVVAEAAADSATVVRLVGTTRNAARAEVLRSGGDRPSPLARWLLALALVLGIGELIVRARSTTEVA
ncbi:MAG: BatA domain-containing protein [bacterium]